MGKEIWKFLPCASYDVERLETFFNDMSKEGYNLRKEGIFLNIAYFEESKQRYYYHLVPIIRKNKDEVIFKEQQEKKGYLYIDKMGDFYIYAHIRPFEIDIDIKAYKQLKNSSPSTLLSGLFTIVLFILFDIEATFLLFVITCGSIQTLVMSILFALWLAKLFDKYFIYKDLYQKKMYHQKREEKEWRKMQRLFLIYQILVVCIGCFLIVNVMFVRLKPKNMVIPEDVSHIPFATLVDFENDKLSYQRDSANSLYGHYSTFSDFLAPINYEWEETGNYTSIHPTNHLNFAILDAYYHETIHPFIASQLVREYAYRNLHHDYYDYIEVDVDPQLYQLDDLRVLANAHHGVYILRLDKKVLCFDLSWDDSEHQIENIIPILKQSLEC